MQHEVNLKLEAKNETEGVEKEKALRLLAKNLNRDSLIILANKSQKAGINEKIKQYQNII